LLKDGIPILCNKGKLVFIPHYHPWLQAKDVFVQRLRANNSGDSRMLEYR